jgi:DNA-binding transcriptional MerR regulator
MDESSPKEKSSLEESSLKESMMKEIREMMEGQHREEIDKARSEQKAIMEAQHREEIDEQKAIMIDRVRSAGYLELVAEMERNYQGDRIFSDQFNEIS